MDNETVSYKWYQDGKGNTSGKRVFGAIALILFLIMVPVLAVYTIKTGQDIGNNAADLIKTVGWIGCSLLGIGVVEGLVKK